MTSVAEIMPVKGENCTNICSQEYKRCRMALSQCNYHTSVFESYFISSGRNMNWVQNEVIHKTVKGMDADTIE